MESLVGWLTELPPAALLGAMTILAALENVFPPIPADVLIALGAFIAARNDASPIPAFVAVLAVTAWKMRRVRLASPLVVPVLTPQFEG